MVFVSDCDINSLPERFTKVFSRNSVTASGLYGSDFIIPYAL